MVDKNYKAASKNCAVCDKRIGQSTYFYHYRLDAYIHSGCPLTNVYGEDISTHTMIWGEFKIEGDDVSG